MLPSINLTFNLKIYKVPKRTSRFSQHFFRKTLHWWWSWITEFFISNLKNRHPAPFDALTHEFLRRFSMLRRCLRWKSNRKKGKHTRISSPFWGRARFKLLKQTIQISSAYPTNNTNWIFDSFIWIPRSDKFRGVISLPHCHFALSIFFYRILRRIFVA